MKIKTKFAKEAILNKNGLNHMQIEVIPPKPDLATNKKPVCIVFVLDRSGSMDGLAANEFNNSLETHFINTDPYGRVWFGQTREKSRKIDYAQDSIIKFLDSLGPDDKIGIVSFDDIAFVEQELTSINDPAVKNAVIRNIRSITPRGCTNISDALKTARKLFTEDIISRFNCKIILLSDGEANRGIYTVDGLASVALECSDGGITISSLGIGLDYNAAVMGEIARSGNGLFYHIKDLSSLETIFKEELQLTNMIAAKNVKLLVSIPYLIEISENLNGYVQSVNNDNIEVSLGDMYGPRKIVFEIRNNFVDDDVSFNVEVVYKDLEDNQRSVKTSCILKVVKNKEDLKNYKEDKALIEYVLSLIKNRTLLQSSAMYELGQKNEIAGVFTVSSAMINDMSKTYLSAEPSINLTAASLNQTGSLYACNVVSKDMIKEMYAKSYKESRQ